jgi:hypothetical protein
LKIQIYYLKKMSEMGGNGNNNNEVKRIATPSQGSLHGRSKREGSKRRSESLRESDRVRTPSLLFYSIFLHLLLLLLLLLLIFSASQNTLKTYAQGGRSILQDAAPTSSMVLTSEVQ